MKSESLLISALFFTLQTIFSAEIAAGLTIKGLLQAGDCAGLSSFLKDRQVLSGEETVDLLNEALEWKQLDCLEIFLGKTTSEILDKFKLQNAGKLRRLSCHEQVICGRTKVFQTCFEVVGNTLYSREAKGFEYAERNQATFEDTLTTSLIHTAAKHGRIEVLQFLEANAVIKEMKDIPSLAYSAEPRILLTDRPLESVLVECAHKALEGFTSCAQGTHQKAAFLRSFEFLFYWGLLQMSVTEPFHLLIISVNKAVTRASDLAEEELLRTLKHRLWEDYKTSLGI